MFSSSRGTWNLCSYLSTLTVLVALAKILERERTISSSSFYGKLPDYYPHPLALPLPSRWDLLIVPGAAERNVKACFWEGDEVSPIFPCPRARWCMWSVCGNQANSGWFLFYLGLMLFWLVGVGFENTRRVWRKWNVSRVFQDCMKKIIIR